ncbi:hypothetical protein HPP92_004990 [Vanilla planifolia]|uniref:Uncharacterized protein n=1 Tax=Vanilla planifolia TaxID=51239 RepID=A0A835RT66_VANPL|nr:hypothetical protein HPP92_004990 [Vanilla planifolia]
MNSSAAFVASASSESDPTLASRRVTASATVRAIVLTVSNLGEMGTIPDRLVIPAVGFIPTTEFIVAGEPMAPSKSVARVTETKLAATATADPLLVAPEFVEPG